MKKSYFAGLLVAALVVLGLASPAEEASAPEPVARGSESDAILGLPTLTASEVIVGKASWYGPGFDGRPTSSGVLYNRFALTAAHRKLRAGTVVRVTNLRNQRSAVLVINDWGPVPADLEIDVSEAAADVLGFREQGVTRVRIEVYRAANNSR